MSLSNRVLGKEGLCIRPQHFQQESRFLTSQLKQVIDISAYNLGFEKIAVDQQQLSFGKFGITECKGVMPDGDVYKRQRHYLIKRVLNYFQPKHPVHQLSLM